ncbi:MAG TPA: ABC transporter permease subunit, partial [Methanobacterium sp.]
MKFHKSWVVAGKDFKIFRKKKRILYALIVLPLLLSVGLPLFLISAIGAADPGEVAVILNSFSFFYIILAYLMPNSLASYSILGEKIEQSLEPLLATPITDGELLLGKMIASFLPCVAMVYVGSVIFMALSDVIT